MKKILLASLVPLLLAACVSASSLTEQIRQVQDYTSTFCKFVPTVSVITALFNKDAGATVSGLGGAICNAISTQPLADGPGAKTPRLNGVALKGTYLK